MDYPISLDVIALREIAFNEWFAGLPEGNYVRSSLRAAFKRRLKKLGLPVCDLDFVEMAKAVKFYEIEIGGLKCYQKGGGYAPGKLFVGVSGGVII